MLTPPPPTTTTTPPMLQVMDALKANKLRKLVLSLMLDAIIIAVVVKKDDIVEVGGQPLRQPCAAPMLLDALISAVVVRKDDVIWGWAGAIHPLCPACIPGPPQLGCHAPTLALPTPALQCRPSWVTAAGTVRRTSS